MKYHLGESATGAPSISLLPQYMGDGATVIERVDILPGSSVIHTKDGHIRILPRRMKKLAVYDIFELQILAKNGKLPFEELREIRDIERGYRESMLSGGKSSEYFALNFSTFRPR